MTKNKLVIIGDSRLDLPYFVQRLTSSDQRPSSFPYNYQLHTKYYQSSIDIHILTEVDLIEFTLNPTSNTSQQISTLLSSTNGCIVLFDMNSEKNSNNNNNAKSNQLPLLSGFNFIRSLYTSQIHEMVSQIVDVHILLGVTHYNYGNVNGTESTDDNGEKQNNNIFQLNDKVWSYLQNYALDYNMQLIVYDNYPTDIMKNIKYNNFEKKLNLSLLSKNEQDNNDNSDDDMADDNDDDEEFELDDSEVGQTAVFSALSCCQWPQMERVQKTAPKISISTATTSISSTNDVEQHSDDNGDEDDNDQDDEDDEDQSDDDVATTENNTPTGPIVTAKQVGLLNSTTTFQQKQEQRQQQQQKDSIVIQASDFDNFDCDFGQFGDDAVDGQDEFYGYQGMVDDLDGLGSTYTQDPKQQQQQSITNTNENKDEQINNNPTTTTNDNNNSESTKPESNQPPAADATKDKAQEDLERYEQIQQLEEIENLFAQMSMFTDSVKQGKVKNDQQRRDQATKYALMLAAAFGMDDIDDMSGDDNNNGEITTSNKNNNNNKKGNNSKQTNATTKSKQGAKKASTAKPASGSAKKTSGTSTSTTGKKQTTAANNTTKQKKHVLTDPDVDDPFFALFSGMGHVGDEENMDLNDLEQMFSKIDQLDAALTNKK